MLFSSGKVAGSKICVYFFTSIGAQKVCIFFLLSFSSEKSILMLNLLAFAKGTRSVQINLQSGAHEIRR